MPQQPVGEQYAQPGPVSGYAEEIQRRINALGGVNMRPQPMQPHDLDPMAAHQPQNSYPADPYAQPHPEAPTYPETHSHPIGHAGHHNALAPGRQFPFADANPAQFHPPMYADSAPAYAHPPLYADFPAPQRPDNGQRDLERVKASIDQMSARLQELQAAGNRQYEAPHAPVAQAVHDQSQLLSQIADLKSAIAAVSNTQPGKEEYADLKKTLGNIGQVLAERSKKVDSNPVNVDAYAKVVETSHTNLAKQIEQLTQTISSSNRNPDVFSKTLEASHDDLKAQIESLQVALFTDVGKAVEGVQQVSDLGSSIMQEIGNIQRKLEQNITANGVSSEEVSMIEMRLEEVTRAIVAMSNGGNNIDQLERIEARISDLSKNIGTNATSGLSADSAGYGLNEEILARLDELQDRIENISVATVSGSGEADESNNALLMRLNDLVERVGPANTGSSDETISLISNQLNELSELINTGGMSGIGNEAFLDQVEQRISLLLQGGTHDSESGALKSIGDRLKSIEEQVASSRDIALELASQAAEDAVAKAAQSFPSHLEGNIPSGVEAADIVGLSEDIRQLQQSTTQSGAETVHTFDAVRDTLERMVERLNSIEIGMSINPQTGSASEFSADESISAVSAAVAQTHEALELDTAETPQAEAEIPPFDEPVPLVETRTSGNDMVAEYRAVIAQEEVEAEPTGKRSIGQALVDEASRVERERQKSRAAKAPKAESTISKNDQHEFQSDPSVAIDLEPAEVQPPSMDDPLLDAGEVAYPTDDFDSRSDMEDTPLEPGSAGPDLAALVRQANERRKSVAKATGESSGTEFIAAARRAAQAAAEEANAVQNELSERAAEKEKGIMAALPSLFSKRKKVVMMAAAAVLLAAIAVPVVGSMIGLNDDAQVAGLDGTKAAVVSLSEEPAIEKDYTEQVRVVEATNSISNDVNDVKTDSADLGPAPSVVESSQPAVTYEGEVEFANAALTQAVSENNPMALFEVGRRYMDGQGTEKDMSKAVLWIERAANLEYAPAQYLIGNFAEKGIGIDKNREAAIEWYKKAAGNGNIVAMHNLAVLHATPAGASGEPDMELAFEWFKKAAEHGVRDSQVNLGIFYTKGVGTEVNLVEAYRWFTIAAKAGDKDAESKRDVIVDALRPDQLESAATLVETWKPVEVQQASNSVAQNPDWISDLASASISDNKNAVQQAQAMLAKLGYDAGPADGIMGKRTREAIAQFQQRVGLAINGEVSVELLKELEAIAI